MEVMDIAACMKITDLVVMDMGVMEREKQKLSQDMDMEAMDMD